MTAKFGQARIEAFLAALRETGNQSIAAERAKVSTSWVSLHRQRDAQFRRAYEAAVGEAKSALRDACSACGSASQPRSSAASQDGRIWDGRSCKPPAGWGFLDGEELVVRGTGGSGGGKRVQIARARLRQWSPRAEERFLATLAATCNVTAACAEVGLTPASAYNHRNRWQRFAERWNEAIEIGYTQLECGLIERAGNLFSGEGPVDIGPIREMTADHAIHLLQMHKHQVHRIGKRPGLRAREPDIEDVRAELMRKAAALKRRRALQGARRRD